MLKNAPHIPQILNVSLFHEFYIQIRSFTVGIITQRCQTALRDVREDKY